MSTIITASIKEIRHCFFFGPIIPELQNRVMHYDVTNQVTDCRILFF